MNKILLIASLSIVGLLPFYTHAGPILRTGETVSVDSAQILTEDFYGFGSRVLISGSGENDLYLAGGAVTVNAPVAHDLTILGGEVQVHGSVGDDLRVIGGDVVIAEPIKGDVVVMSGSLTILSTAHVEGDVLFFGNELTVDGPVAGAIHGTADTMRFNAEIGGDVSVTVASLFTIGSKAQMKGNITYVSSKEVVRAQDAIIAGTVEKISSTQKVNGNTLVHRVGFEVFVLVFATLFFYFIVRKHIHVIVSASSERVGFSGIIGLLMFIGLPIVWMTLFFSVLGILAGAVVFIAYIGLVLTAIALSPILVGLLIQKAFLKSADVSLKTVGIGLVSFLALSFVPYVGGVLVAASVLSTLGGMGITLYNRVQTQ